MTPRKRQEAVRRATIEDIKATARQLMAEKGIAGLSVRAIGRRMEISAPAIYYYFDSLDDLITALIADAYHGLADDLTTRLGTLAALTPAEQAYRLMLAYRAWALAHPVDFNLIYGSPIPGYTAPEEVTMPAARRTFGLFVSVLARAEAIDALDDAHIPASVRESLEQVRAVEGYEAPLAALYFSVIGWTKLHGLIMLELFNHMAPLVTDVDALFRAEIARFLRGLGLPLAAGIENEA